MSDTADGLTNTPVQLHGQSTLFVPMLATAITCCVLTTLFISIRLYTRYVSKNFAPEDYLLIISGVVYIGYNALAAVSGHVGVGHFLWYVPGSTDFSGLKYPWVLELLFSPLIVAVRTALVLQLIRIFAPTRRDIYYWSFQAIIWLNVVFYLAVEIALFLNCQPLDKIWTPLKEGRCINAQALLLAVMAVNIASDLLALVLPIAAIWHLQMAVKRKVGSTFVFGVGLIALATSSLRLAYCVRAYKHPDESYFLGQVTLCSMGEVAALILVTCFPVMPLFLQIITGKRSQKGKSSGYRSYEMDKNNLTHASDQTALTDPEAGKTPAAGNVAAAWSGRGNKPPAIANMSFQDVSDGDTLGAHDGLSSTSEESVTGIEKAAGPHRIDGKIKRTVSVNLSEQYV